MDEQVKQLAETLRKNGLAASEYEAIEKAKSILNVKVQKSDTSQQDDLQQNPEQGITNEKSMPNLGIDIKNESTPLNELMKEVNVSPEEVEAQEQEKLDNMQGKIDDIKEDIKEAKENPEKVEQIKEEIANVKDEVDKIAEVTTKENPQESENQLQEDRFKEEKKIDLTKVFGNKR
jgi:predicted  nucleic acid-binding Zn-ribbon protein